IILSCAFSTAVIFRSTEVISLHSTQLWCDHDSLPRTLKSIINTSAMFFSGHQSTGVIQQQPFRNPVPASLPAECHDSRSYGWFTDRSAEVEAFFALQPVDALEACVDVPRRAELVAFATTANILER
uniref:SAM domain-containing protein n=1 Tax=Parascaris univalens TaxID=6257 RepID=A0A915BZ28_PARUN